MCAPLLQKNIRKREEVPSQYPLVSKYLTSFENMIRGNETRSTLLLLIPRTYVPTSLVYEHLNIEFNTYVLAQGHH